MLVRFPCSRIFLRGMTGMFQVVCQLFLGIFSPLSYDSHLLSGGVFMANRLTGLTGSRRPRGTPVGRLGIGICVHNRMVPQQLPERKSAPARPRGACHCQRRGR